MNPAREVSFMMHIRDISLRKRLLAANFIMVFVPVLILACVTTILIAGLRFTASQDNAWITWWPEKGPAMSIQYTVSSLRVKVDKLNKPKFKNIIEDCHILESQGIYTALFYKDEPVYVTEGADAMDMQKEVRAYTGGQRSAMIWDERGFYFVYQGHHSPAYVVATGNVPFLNRGGIQEGTAKNILLALLLLIAGIAIGTIVLTGLWLSRLLSRQILEPLGALRTAEAAIRCGSLDYPLVVDRSDELGEACADFNAMRQELKKNRDERNRYEQSRKELIAGISHDLSTPLTLIKGYASAILEGIAIGTDKKEYYMKQIYRNACTLEHLVDSLFLFSRLELGRVPFRWEQVDMARYFEDFTIEQQPVLSERGLDLFYKERPRDHADSIVWIDRVQFGRVVENIIENSIRYKVADRIRVDISIVATAHDVILTFADDGPGVPDEALSRLFDSFYRTDKARTDIQKGNGLGLAVTKQIIEAMDGSIKAVPSAGHGLTLCITLPLAKEVVHDEEHFDH